MNFQYRIHIRVLRSNYKSFFATKSPVLSKFLQRRPTKRRFPIAHRTRPSTGSGEKIHSLFFDSQSKLAVPCFRFYAFSSNTRSGLCTRRILGCVELRVDDVRLFLYTVYKLSLSLLITRKLVFFIFQRVGRLRRKNRVLPIVFERYTRLWRRRWSTFDGVHFIRFKFFSLLYRN